MSSITGAGTTPSNQSTNGGIQGNDLRTVDMNHFLQLMITEMQNQDPLNPMDNAQMLTQLSQIRQIGASNQLSETLQNFSVGQQLSMASSIIGKQVSGLDINAKEVAGTVDRVSVQTDPKDPSIRKVSVHIGDSVVDMNNIRQIESN